jgi:hypothetical protein
MNKLILLLIDLVTIMQTGYSKNINYIVIRSNNLTN